MEKAARTQALVDFSHLPKNDLLRLAAPQKKGLGRGKNAPASSSYRGDNFSSVKSAAQASAARRRGRHSGVSKHKKHSSAPASLPHLLENRFYRVSISVDDDKVYATPMPPKPPPSPPPPAKNTQSRNEDRSSSGLSPTGPSCRPPGRQSRGLQPRGNGSSSRFGGRGGEGEPRGAQVRNKNKRKQRKRALSGRERRQQRSTAAIEIQRVARGRAARLRVKTMKELRLYAQSLTRKAQVRYCSCCCCCCRTTNSLIHSCDGPQHKFIHSFVWHCHMVIVCPKRSRLSMLSADLCRPGVRK